MPRLENQCLQKVVGQLFMHGAEFEETAIMVATVGFPPPPPPASRLVMQAMPAWSVKTRRGPSRHCGDARVYGNIYDYTGMHNRTTLPPTPSVCPPSLHPLYPSVAARQFGGHRYRGGQSQRQPTDYDPPPDVRTKPGGVIQRAAAAALATPVPQHGGEIPHPRHFVWQTG